MQKKRMTKGILCFLLSGVFFCSGCGKSSEETASGYDNIETAAMETYDAGSDSGWTQESVVQSDEAAAGQAGSVSNDGSAALKVQESLNSRKLIKNASLSLETKEFAKTVTSIETEIETLGGYAEYSNVYSNGEDNRKSGNITARIPSDKLEEFLAAVGDLAVIRGKSENVQDVTLSYTDTQEHKKALQTEYDRVTQLLEKAEDIEQILILESKLSDLRYQIDSYESQLRVYDNQVDYSTVNLDITEVRYETETAVSMGDKIKNGFWDSLHQLRDGAEGVIIFLAANSPVILAGVFILVVIWILVRKKMKKSAARKENMKNHDAQRAETDTETDTKK